MADDKNKFKKTNATISINPMQDDLEKLSGLGASLAGVKEVVKKTGKKISDTIYKNVGAESKFSKTLMSKPKTTATGLGTIAVGKEIKKIKEGYYDKDISETEGSFAKGGLLRAGKPKLAKKGWR